MNRRPRCRTRERGVTIIEALVALGILSVTLFGVMALARLARGQERAGDVASTVASLARARGMLQNDLENAVRHPRSGLAVKPMPDGSLVLWRNVTVATRALPEIVPIQWRWAGAAKSAHLLRSEWDPPRGAWRSDEFPTLRRRNTGALKVPPSRVEWHGLVRVMLEVPAGDNAPLVAQAVARVAGPVPDLAMAPRKVIPGTEVEVSEITTPE